jgi:Tannase and feruloyl esterase
MKLRRVSLWIVAGVALCALTAIVTLKAAGAPAPSENLKPAVTCEEMNGKAIPASAISLPTGGAKIASARLMPAADAPAAAPAPFGGSGNAVPEYCAVTGAILPVDPNAPEIHFQVDIPTAWNGEAIQEGGGGLDGIIPPLVANPARGELQGTLPGSPSILAQGFALFGSDSGHQMTAGPGGPPGRGPGTAPRPDHAAIVAASAWLNNQEAWKNFAYEQLKKTHDTVVEVLRVMYGSKPRLSYFAGTSQGGREAIEALSRYPGDYDGVISQVPVVYFAGLLIDPTIKGEAQIAPGAWVPPSKNAAVAAETLRLCDTLDGLGDGVINNYVACDRLLDPGITADPLKNIRCPGGEDTGDSCLSDKQMATVNLFHATEKFGFSLANGETDWPGWGTGLENGTGFLGSWLTVPAQPDPANPAAFSGGIGETWVKGLLGGGQDFNLLTLDLKKAQTQFQSISDLTDPRADWSGFFNRKGKLILITGASDYISNPRAQMRLYDEVVKRSGQATVDQSVRYYVSPNVGHGLTGNGASGLPVPNAVDAFAYLRNWVEKGTAPPDAMVQSRYSKTAPYTIEASRPLCRYPKYPRYKGAGDSNSFDSYVCAMP